jgi:uncharacterized Zn-finger protein
MDDDERVEPTTDGDTVTLAISMPLDRGFLRRRCGSCEREFKRFGDRVKDTSEDAVLTCPYCYQSAPRDEWWTPDQRAYMRNVTYEKVVAPKLREFQRSLKGMGGGSLGLSFDLKGIEQAPALPPQEVTDMARVEFPCHPDEALRVAEDWEFDVACTICGTRYPYEDARHGEPAA